MVTARGRVRSVPALATLCVLASSVEWYDFFLYATASATVLGASFFTPLGALGGTLAAFGTFALAFLARPLGGLVFGVVGDRIGRRAALATATTTMGLASTLIGVLPTYATTGLVAPVLLVVLRLVQGIALGGQWAGSVLLLTENAPARRRGLYGSIAQLGSPIGGVAANGLFFLFSATLSPAAFASWGWRVPFLVSIAFVGLGLLLQRLLEDSAAFRALDATSGRTRAPVVEVLRTRPREVLLAAGTFVAASASLYVFITFLLTYLPSALGVARSTALWVTTVTQLAQVPGILVGAAVSDRLGRKRTYLTAAIASAVWAFPAFLLIDTGSVVAVAVALTVAHVVLGAMYGPLAALFTELFATRVRYSGASLGYQIGTVLGGGLAPIIATALFAAIRSSFSVAGYLVVVSVITIVAAACLRDRAGARLAPDTEDDTQEPVADRAASAGRMPAGSGSSDGEVDALSTPAPRRRRRLRDTRVRTRLIALIAVPTAVAVALGVVGLTGAVAAANAYGRAATLADLADAVTTAAVALDDEQDATAAFVAAGRPAPLLVEVTDAQRRTDRATAEVRARAARIGDGYAPSTRDRLARAVFRLDALPALRAAATTSRLPWGVVVDQYASLGTDLLAVDDEVAQDGGDPALSATVRALGALSRARLELATERALVRAAFTAGGFEPGGAQALVDADAARTGDIARFRAAADQAQAQLYDDVVAGVPVDDTEARLGGLIRTGAPPVPAGGPPAASTWDAAASGTLARLHTVEASLVHDAADRAHALRSSQIRRALIAGAIALAVLLVALLATVLVVRSLTRPLRALRRGALEVAEDRLPVLVGRLGREDPSRVDTRVDPVGVDSRDEIGEVARSFDEVHQEAVRLAAAEAHRRVQTGALFVNLSRRTQSLVERQLELIDDLERSEEDSDRLGELFRLDHLATRMRRNGENLLVLGGQEPLRRWNRVMSLLDVLRAAVSEVEQYTRVELATVPEVYVAEGAVSDLVHLFAELVENATNFSARSTPVTVETTLLPDRSVLVEVTDQGIGLREDDYADLNARLAAGGEGELAPDVSRRMGLVVVARLAARQGVTVRLRPGPTGVIAAVTLPPAVLADTASTSPAGAPDTRAAGGEGSWIGERWSRAVATPGPGADSWFGSAPLPGTGSKPPVDAGRAVAHRAGDAPGAVVDAPADAAFRAPGFTPSAAGTTSSGLPQRAPGANQVPGAVPGAATTGSATPPDSRPREPAPTRESAPARGPALEWDRSPAAVRHRYAGVQRGRARGRVESAAAVGDVAGPALAPSAAGTTTTGLPLREPGANYVPGAAPPDPGAGEAAQRRPLIVDPPGTSGGRTLDDAGEAGDTADGGVAAGASWDRSAEAIRRRFAAHQQGRQRAQEARRS